MGGISGSLWTSMDKRASRLTQAEIEYTNNLVSEIRSCERINLEIKRRLSIRTSDIDDIHIKSLRQKLKHYIENASKTQVALDQICGLKTLDDDHTRVITIAGLGVTAESKILDRDEAQRKVDILAQNLAIKIGMLDATTKDSGDDVDILQDAGHDMKVDTKEQTIDTPLSVVHEDDVSESQNLITGTVSGQAKPKQQKPIKRPSSKQPEVMLLQ